MRPRIISSVLAGLLGLGLLLPADAPAGCGCEKPAPPVAPIRPEFASPGDTVRIFSPALKDGVRYRVVFQSSRSFIVWAMPVVRRDFADGQMKRQLVVQAPSLPPGPASVRVERGYGTPVLQVPSNAFTMLQRPLKLPESDGSTIATCYSAAVGADGTVYFPVDISAIDDHMIFAGLGNAYPLRYTAADIAIYNTQGVLMQLLGPAEAGIFAIDDAGAANSFELVYDRHEFQTYRAEHAHAGGRGLDARDPAWHTDGTRHVDHDRLVIAISGVLANGQVPFPGQTQPFDFEVTTVLAEGAAGPVVTSVMPWSDACGSRGRGGRSSDDDDSSDDDSSDD